MRKRLRLPTFDYSLGGAYFVTTCTYRRRPLLEGAVAAIVEAELCAVQHRFAATLDYHVIMPDHLHAIIVLPGGGATLSQVVGAFKSRAAVEVYRRGLVSGRFWQARFFDHVIRDERDLLRVREYVQGNPKAKALADGRFADLQRWLDTQYAG